MNQKIMLTLQTKKEVYELTKSHIIDIVKNKNEANDLMIVMSSIWNIYKMSNTEDKRYDNLGDEIEKHFIMNDDWPTDKLFIGKLHILDDDHKFLLFIEQLLNLYLDSDLYQNYKNSIAPFFNNENVYILEEKDKNGQTTVVMYVGDKENSVRMEDRNIIFHVCQSKITDAVHFGQTEIDWPNEQQCFVLTFNSGWNDNFKYHTRYKLFYINHDKREVIGEVKIMKKKYDKTSDTLPTDFYSLDSEYCSLGQNEEYYQNMYKIFGNKAYIYLAEMCDAALYSNIHKKFEKEEAFIHSLIRTNNAERALRLGRYIVYGRDTSKAFTFQYQFIPPYDKLKENKVLFDFDFTPNTVYYKRAIALIGENGVGKSTLMQKMVKEIVTNTNTNFNGLNPLFSCVMAISYSPFDDYPLSKSLEGNIIDYVYCGLTNQIEEKDKRVVKKELLTKDMQIEHFVKNVHKIQKRGDEVLDCWIENVKKIIAPDAIASVVSIDFLGIKKVIDSELQKMYENASSGESIFLSIISAILANIRYDSILFLDEPEQHLHPAGITLLIGSIMKILSKYNSFAIISTHSPFIIREIPSSNVMILHKVNNLLYSSSIGTESFGEDVSTISNFVFEDLCREKRYEEIISNLAVEYDYDFDKIVKALQGGTTSLGLNTLLLINSVIRKKRKQE